MFGSNLGPRSLSIVEHKSLCLLCKSCRNCPWFHLVTAQAGLKGAHGSGYFRRSGCSIKCLMIAARLSGYRSFYCFSFICVDQVCWSAHGNELRVYSTARLEPHSGHGTAGLPEQALFRFSSELEQPQQQWEPVRGTASGDQSIIHAGGGSSVSTAGVSITTGSPGSPSRARGRNVARLLPVRGRNDGSRHGSSPRGSDCSPRERAGTAKMSAGSLSVRAVEAVEIRDGRTILVCLVSERGLASEVRCVAYLSLVVSFYRRASVCTLCRHYLFFFMGCTVIILFSSWK